jgi:hypothetical protein
MSWPTLVQLVAGTLEVADSEIDLAGTDAAIDAFLDALATTIENRNTSQ